jgi:tetrahydromethanopterin S-methyltransferase subunit G
MVALKEKEIVITIPAEEPSRKLAELQSGLIYVIHDFFGHLGNEVDVDSGAAYGDVIGLLRAMMLDEGQLGRIVPIAGKE